MISFFTVVIVLLCLLIIPAVLLQPAKGGGATPLGGSSQSVFGSTGGTTFLFRFTMWSGLIVMALAVLLSRLRLEESKKSVIDASTLPSAAPATNPATPDSGPAPIAPAGNTSAPSQ